MKTLGKATPSASEKAKRKLEELKALKAHRDGLRRGIVAQIQAVYADRGAQLKLAEDVVRDLCTDSECNGCRNEDLAHNRALAFIAGLAGNFFDPTPDNSDLDEEEA